MSELSELYMKTEAVTYDWANHETRDTIDVSPVTMDEYVTVRGLTLDADDLGCQPGADFRISLYLKSNNEYEDRLVDTYDTTAE
jgi:hypothetical protein